MINACIDYNIESTEIIRMIALVETKPELLGSISQVCSYGSMSYVTFQA